MKTVYNDRIYDTAKMTLVTSRATGTETETLYQPKGMMHGIWFLHTKGQYSNDGENVETYEYLTPMVDEYDLDRVKAMLLEKSAELLKEYFPEITEA